MHNLQATPESTTEVIQVTINLLEGDRIVSAKERKRLIPFSNAHWDRLEKDGKVPRRIRLGEHRVGWSLMALQDWLDERERGEAPAQG